jgi:hypothetical protein
MTRAWHQNIKRSSAADRTVDGIVFDSKSEARRWAELKLLERAGKISGLRRQDRLPLAIGGTEIKIRSKGFPNGRPCVYTADFSYCDWSRGVVSRVFEEHKGHDTPESRLRRAVVEAIYGIEIIVTGPAARNTPRVPLRIAEAVG